MDPFILLNFKLYEFISCSQNKQFGSFVKIGSLYDTAIPLLGNYPREIIKTHIHTQTCIQIYSDLAGWHGWIFASVHQKVEGSIPGTGAHRKATNQCFSLTWIALSISLSLSLLPHSLPLPLSLKSMKTYPQVWVKKIMCIATLFIRAKKWHQMNWSPDDERTDKMWCAHTMAHYSAHKEWRTDSMQKHGWTSKSNAQWKNPIIIDYLPCNPIYVKCPGWSNL